MKTDSEIYNEVFGENSNGCYHFPELKQLVLLYAKAYHEDKTRWISVEEEEPKDSMPIWVTNGNVTIQGEFIKSAYCFVSNHFDGKIYTCGFEKFTHWRLCPPLPTPPKINAE